MRGRKKVKVRLSLRFFFRTPRHEDILGEWRYSSTHSLTSALDGGEWSASRPRPLYPQGKSPWYPLDRRLGGPHSRSECGGEEKNSQHLVGFEPPIIQPVAQRCTTRIFTLRHRVQTSFCGPPSLLSNGHRGPFPGAKWPRKMTTHLHLVPKVRMRGAILLSPNTSSGLSA
jgi:hypothetical protein